MKVAIIGMGPMGVRHIAAVGKVLGLELSAVCDSRPEALEKTGLDPNVARYLSAEELLDKAPPDLLMSFPTTRRTTTRGHGGASAVAADPL
jgi:predicted dehydrogenase